MSPVPREVEKRTARKGPIIWLLRTSLMVLGAAISLRLAVYYLEPIWPYAVLLAGVTAITWVVVAIIRWRGSRW